MPAHQVIRLPVCRRPVSVRPLDGADEVAVGEARASDLEAALVLVQRVAEPADGEAADWATLSVTDFEVLLLAIRRGEAGDMVRSDFDCPRPACGERVEIEFRLGDLLAAAAPRSPRGVRADPERPGWRRLGETAFRPPSVEDLVHARRGGGAAALAERCLAPPVGPGRLRARVERAIEAVAPQVSRPVEGSCPACGETLRALFHVPAFVVAELRGSVGRLTEEVDLIASAYHWPEADILALPRTRRQDYAERIRRRQAA